MTAWPIPQYSKQRTVYFPGFVNVSRSTVS